MSCLYVFWGHPGCQQPLSSLTGAVSSPSSPFHQWYPSSVAPRDVGTDLLLKSCVFQLLGLNFACCFQERVLFLVILVKPLATFCCGCFLGAKFRSCKGWGGVVPELFVGVGGWPC